MEETSDIVVRNLDEGFVRLIRADMALRGQSLKAWLIEACQARLGEQMDVRVQHPPRPEPAPIPERPGEHPCPECGVYMVRNEKLRQWECPSCHFIDRKKF